MSRRTTTSDKLTVRLGPAKRLAAECAERKGINLTAWLVAAIEAAAERQERTEKKRQTR